MTEVHFVADNRFNFNQETNTYIVAFILHIQLQGTGGIYQ